MKISQVVLLSAAGDVLLDKKLVIVTKMVGFYNCGDWKSAKMRTMKLFVHAYHKHCSYGCIFRYDIACDAPDLFFARVQSNSDNLLPYWNEKGVWFYHIKRNNIFFIATSTSDELPILIIEVLTKLFHIFKDFCGVISEDSIRENLVLLHELLDEILDFGQIQIASTSKLKLYVQSDPVLVKSDASPETLSPGLFGVEHRVAPNYAADQPVVQSRYTQERRRNEIFVDIIEHLNVLINSDGTIARCEINGKVNMKSILVGNPLIKLGLSPDLDVGKEESEKRYGHQAHIDEVTFHPSIDRSEFDTSRLLKLFPTDGEFSLMTYKLSGNTPKSIPFRITFAVDDSQKDLQLSLKLHCNIPSGSQALNISVKIPVPSNAQSITQQLSGPGQTASLEVKDKLIVWRVKNLPGGTTVSARFKVISSDSSRPNKLQVGPVAMVFEVSSFVCSNLKVQFLRVFDKDHSYVPYKWIRYITHSDSYVIKL